MTTTTTAPKPPAWEFTIDMDLRPSPDDDGRRLMRAIVEEVDARYQARGRPASASLSFSEHFAFFDSLGAFVVQVQALHPDITGLKPGRYRLSLSSARGVQATPLQLDPEPEAEQDGEVEHELAEKELEGETSE